MGRWADWFSAPDEVACEFVRAAESIGDVAVNELLRPFIEDYASDVALDKTWEPIHRCLTGDHGPAHVIDFDAGTRPLKLVVFGGCYLLEAGYRSLQYVCDDEVPEVAEAIAVVKQPWFRERFFALPRNQYHPITEEYFEDVWADFKQVVAFYQKAAERRHVAFCTVAH